jgi:hypothetical protein
MATPRIDLCFGRFLPDLGTRREWRVPFVSDRPAAHAMAFSSEVETGSREENALKQQSKAGSNLIRTDQASGEAQMY